MGTSATMELSAPGTSTLVRPLPVTMLISVSSPGMPFENTMIVSCERGVLQLNFLTSTLNVFRVDGSVETYGGGGSAWAEVGTPALGRAIKGALEGKHGAMEEGGVSVEDLATLVDGVFVQ